MGRTPTPITAGAIAARLVALADRAAYLAGEAPEGGYGDGPPPALHYLAAARRCLESAARILPPPELVEELDDEPAPADDGRQHAPDAEEHAR